MKVELEGTKWEAFLKEVHDLTDENFHTVAAQTIAKYFGYKDEVKTLGYLEKIHEIEGSLVTGMGEYRQCVIDRIFYQLEEDYGLKIQVEVFRCI